MGQWKVFLQGMLIVTTKLLDQYLAKFRLLGCVMPPFGLPLVAGLRKCNLGIQLFPNSVIPPS